jgi:hypothetical protein
MLKKIKSTWRNKVQDTTKEWEEVGMDRFEDVDKSKYSIAINSSFSKRLKFLLTNKLNYRLTSHQFRIILKNPLHDR